MNGLTTGKVASVALALCMLAAACSRTPAGDAEAGRAVYRARCAGCHAAGGEGDPRTMRHLGSAEVQAKTDEELRKDIVEGTGKMQGLSDLSEADVRNVIAYVRRLKTN